MKAGQIVTRFTSIFIYKNDYFVFTGANNFVHVCNDVEYFAGWRIFLEHHSGVGEQVIVTLSERRGRYT